MRLKDISGSEKKKGPGTRAERANEHAVNRQKNRHAERDYFGRVINPQAAKPELSHAAAKRIVDGTVRLDAYLVGRGLAPARDKAKALIDEGVVFVEGSNRVKPSTPIALGMTVEVRRSEAQDAQ